MISACSWSDFSRELSTLGAMPSSSCWSSLKRFGPSSRAATTSSVQRSPTRARASASGERRHRRSWTIAAAAFTPAAIALATDGRSAGHVAGGVEACDGRCGTSRRSAIASAASMPGLGERRRRAVREVGALVQRDGHQQPAARRARRRPRRTTLAVADLDHARRDLDAVDRLGRRRRTSRRRSSAQQQRGARSVGRRRARRAARRGPPSRGRTGSGTPSRPSARRGRARPGGGSPCRWRAAPCGRSLAAVRERRARSRRRRPPRRPRRRAPRRAGRRPSSARAVGVEVGRRRGRPGRAGRRCRAAARLLWPPASITQRAAPGAAEHERGAQSGGPAADDDAVPDVVHAPA